MIPIPGDGKYAGFPLFSNTHLAVPRECNHPEEVKTFLTYLFSYEAQKEVYKSTDNTYPVREDAISNTLAERVPSRDREATFHYLSKVDRFWFGLNTELGEIVKEEVENYLNGYITAEKAAAYLQNRVSILLAEQS